MLNNIKKTDSMKANIKNNFIASLNIDTNGMSLSNYLFQCGVTEFNLALKGKYKKPTVNYLKIIGKELEYMNRLTNHDDLQDHDDGDINQEIIDSFPNGFLVDDNRARTKKNQKTNKNEKNEAVVTSENIFDMINKQLKEEHSESLDQLSTEKYNSSDNETNELDINCCKKCHAKDSLVTDLRANTIVCTNCGVINEELLDHGPEWRQYNNDDSRGEGMNRCGCPSSFFFPKSTQGTMITGINNTRLKRKQTWNSVNYKEKSLNNVFEYITKICNCNKLPKIIIDTSKSLYNTINECKHQVGVNVGKQIIIRGINRKSVIAAIIYKACEINNNPKTTVEVAEYFDLDEKRVTKGIKQFEKIIKNTDNNLFLEQFNTDTAEDFIRSKCPKLNTSSIERISKSDVNLAVKIAHNCCKMKIASDHNPQSIAAGSILVMIKYNNYTIDKKDIAKLFKTSEVTIGKIYNKLEPYTDALVDDEATEYLIKKFKING